MRWLDGIIDSMSMSLSKLQEIAVNSISQPRRSGSWRSFLRDSFPGGVADLEDPTHVTFSAPVQCISIRHICFTFHKLNKLGVEWPLLCNLSASFLLESIISIKVLPLSL